MKPPASMVRVAAVGLLALVGASLAQSASPTSDGFFGPCPAPVHLANGGFESGQLSPWTTESSSSGATAIAAPKVIPSGGYRSGHALEVQFPGRNSIGWYIGQDMGQQCEGAEYDVSFAVNWIGLALHGAPNNEDNFCTIGVAPSYCNGPDSSPGYYNASTTPGWKTYRYTCKSRKTAYANLNVNVQCLARDKLGPFTLRLDDLSVGLAGSATAAPTSGSTAAATATGTGSVAASSGGTASDVPGAPSSIPPIQTGAAGRIRPLGSLAGWESWCLLLGWALYQLLSLHL